MNSTAKPGMRARQKMKGAKLAPAALTRFRRALLAWYDANRRDLPWRHTRDPYAIWLSEIMLQQTRVAAVLDHYRIFLERFPNIAALAAAKKDAILAAWSGLGYYRRARMLHQCARQIVGQYDGRFPNTSESLRALPGIGRYTAAAIASIAFQEPVAVVDGNVERVLQRLDARALTPQQTWLRAQELLAPSRPGDFNQSMMELGATVCLPREPRCSICPIRQWCAAQGPLPRTKTKARQRRQQIWCALDRRDGRVRLVQRPKRASLMAGMWELPQSTNLPPASARDGHWRTFRHSITVTDYTVHVSRNNLSKKDDDKDRRNGPRNNPYKATRPATTSAPLAKWIAIDDLPALPLTGLTRKILKADGVI
jgi:A/G-specific adenine glycosylase